MSIWFTADHHWSHSNIIKYDNRPFDDIHEHNKAMTENWNSVVKKDDTVYHLGDLAFCGPKTIHQILDNLNGKICLIRGNHDKAIRGDLIERFVWVKDYYVLKVHEKETNKHQGIVLFHYPIESWDKKHHNYWHCHGHSHSKIMSPGIARLDVGVTGNNYIPISYDQVKSRIQENLNVQNI